MELNEKHIEEIHERPTVAARALTTIITLPVFFELRNYAEGTANSYGKWSYDNAFKLLLVKSKAYDMVHTEIEALKNRINEMEEKK